MADKLKGEVNTWLVISIGPVSIDSSKYEDIGELLTLPYLILDGVDKLPASITLVKKETGDVEVYPIREPISQGSSFGYVSGWSFHLTNDEN